MPREHLNGLKAIVQESPYLSYHERGHLLREIKDKLEALGRRKSSGDSVAWHVACEALQIEVDFAILKRKNLLESIVSTGKIVEVS